MEGRKLLSLFTELIAVAS